MSEGEGTREPIPQKPAGVAYAPDTPQGQLKGVKDRAKAAFGKYFRGENLQVPKETQAKPDKPVPTE